MSQANGTKSAPQQQNHPPSSSGIGHLTNCYHGDPGRGHKFWEYPRHARLVTAQWDTHNASAFCSHSTYVGTHNNGVKEFRCMGHFKEETNDGAALETMLGMGFAPAVAKYALEREGGDVNNASIYASSHFQGITVGTIAHLPLLQRMESTDIVEAWADAGQTGPRDFSLLPEYEAAYNTMAVRQDIMGASSMEEASTLIKAEIAANPLSRNFEETAISAIRFGFSQNSDRAAVRLHADVHGIASGNMYQGLVGYFQSLSAYQKKFFHAIVRGILLKAKREECDRFELQQVVAYARRGAQECTARKRWVYNSLMRLYLSLSTPGKKGDEDPGRALKEALIQYIGKCKDSAFNTVFIVPSIECFNLMGDYEMSGDADVHGANAYLAVLLSTLGVRTSREPLLHDDYKGVIDFLQAGGNFVAKWVKALWEDRNFGKQAGGIHAERSVQKRVRSNVFCFPGVHSPAELGNVAVNPDAQQAPGREKLAVYLQQFAHYFSSSFLCPRLVNHILQDNRLNQFADHFLKLTPSIWSATDDNARQPESFREFVWEEDEEMNYEFNEKKAYSFFRILGILKAPRM